MSKKKSNKKKLKEVCCEKYKRKGKFCKRCPNRPKNLLDPDRLKPAEDGMEQGFIPVKMLGLSVL